MSAAIPSKLSPRDVGVALRSLPRRVSALDNQLSESNLGSSWPETRTSDGPTPLAMLRASAENLTQAVASVHRMLASPDGPPVMVDVPDGNVHGDIRGGQLAPLIDAIGTQAESLADLVENTRLESFAITATSSAGDLTLLDYLQRIVGSVTANVRALERLTEPET